MLKQYEVFCKFYHKLFRGELTEKQMKEFVDCRNRIKERGVNGERLAHILIKKATQKSYLTCIYDI